MLKEYGNVEEDVELKDVRLGKYTEVKAHSVLEDVVFGDYTYCAGYNQIFAADIGKFCSIASFVRINPGNHPTYTRPAQHHFTYRRQQFGFGADDRDFFAWRKRFRVRIGNDVWLGHNVTVMPGVTIGNGAVVGSGAVVTHDVPPYTIVAGVPARKIKERFPKAAAEALERIAWWDWPHALIRERMEDFENIEAFLQKYDTAKKE